MRRLILLAASIAVVFLMAAPPYESASAQPPDFSRAIEAQERHIEALMNTPGVAGSGVGISAAGEPVIRIFLERPGVATPPSLDNVPVEVVVTGRFEARCASSASWCRPAPLGVSTGHPSITAGTIGARVVDEAGTVYALSNNHVYANTNNASIGDPILQPGPYDGGSVNNPAHHIGTLADFEPIVLSTSANNIMDAAIAETTRDQVSNVTLLGHKPAGALVEPAANLKVKKEGRTTGLTTGSIAETNVMVSVCYVPRGPFMCAQAARFVSQFTVTPGSFSAGGDSGSLIVTDSGNNGIAANRPVGLLFAGSSTRTIASPIGPVFTRFGVKLDESNEPAPPSPPTGPTASFTYSCAGLTCSFTSTSTAGTGSITSHAWSFGDGASSSETHPSHTYAGGDTYTVTLTVTDSNNLSNQTSQNVTVTAPTSPPGDPDIDLQVNGYRQQGLQKADLTWSGAEGNVNITRNGTQIALDVSGPSYHDAINNRGGGSYTYQVCEAGSGECSAEVTITF